MLLGQRQVLSGVSFVPKRSAGEPGQLAYVTVSKGNRCAVWSEVLEPFDRIRYEAPFSLLAVGDDRRPGGLEPLDRVQHRGVVQRIQLVLPYLAGGELAHSFYERRRSGDTADGLGRYRHRKKPPLM